MLWKCGVLHCSLWAIQTINFLYGMFKHTCLHTIKNSRRHLCLSGILHVLELCLQLFLLFLQASQLKTILLLQLFQVFLGVALVQEPVYNLLDIRHSSSVLDLGEGLFVRADLCLLDRLTVLQTCKPLTVAFH